MKIVSTSKKHKRRRRFAAGTLALIPVTTVALHAEVLSGSLRATLNTAGALTETPDHCVELETTQITSASDITVDIAYSDQQWTELPPENVVRGIGEYGISLSIIDKSNVQLQDMPLGPAKYEPMLADAQFASASALFEAVSVFPGEMIRTMRPHIRIVDSIDIDPKHPHEGSYGGLQFTDSLYRTGYSDIVIADEESTKTYVHELAHAVQDLLCDDGSRFNSAVSDLQSSGRIQPYLKDIEITLQPWVTSIWADRQFASPYGAQNAQENWATMFTELLHNRGIVLEGDKDWGSPYHMVQSAMIQDIEARFPGFTQSLTDITIRNRISPLGSYNRFVAQDFKRPQYSSFNNSAWEAENYKKLFDLYENGSLSFDYLRGSTFVIVDPDHHFSEFHADIVHDPIIIQDSVGFTYIGYTDHASQFKVTKYDPERITVLAHESSELLSSNGSSVTGSPDSSIFVDGHPIAQLSAPLDSDTVAQKYRDLFYTMRLLSPKEFISIVQPF